MNQAQLDRMSLLFKALSDPARLRILGLLAERPNAGHELATKLGLTPPTISHHVRRLADAGLIDVTPDAQARIYSLRTEPLLHASRALAPESDGSAMAREANDVIRTFFDGPRLRQIPASRKKRVLVVRRLLELFEPGRDYPEQEVNEILRTAHEDVATLRRELVDYRFMHRNKGIYRVASTLPDRGATVAQEVGNERLWFAEFVAEATDRAISDAAHRAGRMRPLLPEETPESDRDP